MKICFWGVLYDFSFLYLSFKNKHLPYIFYNSLHVSMKSKPLSSTIFSWIQILYLSPPNKVILQYTVPSASLSCLLVCMYFLRFSFITCWSLLNWSMYKDCRRISLSLMIKATSSAVYTPACLQSRKTNIKLYMQNGKLHDILKLELL